MLVDDFSEGTCGWELHLTLHRADLQLVPRWFHHLTTAGESNGDPGSPGSESCPNSVQGS